MAFRVVAQDELNMATDWPCMIESKGQDGSVKMKLSMKDPALYNRPLKLHSCWFPTQIPAGLTATQAVSSQFHAVADVPAYNNTEIFVDIPPPNPGPPPGLNKLLVIGEFAN